MALLIRSASARGRLLPVLVLGAALVGPAEAAPAAGPTEYEVKGAYLYKFTRYVDWPASAFGGAGSPFVIAVADRDGAATGEIRAELGGKAIFGRPIEVVRAGDGPRSVPGRCQMVFVSRSSAADWPALRAAFAGRPVLLVGEFRGFAETGGAINFYVEGGQVRFEINPGEASRSGLGVSGNLASVARLVRDRAED